MSAESDVSELLSEIEERRYRRKSERLLVRRRRTRFWLVAALVTLALVRLYFQFVPRGAGPPGFALATERGADLHSPDGAIDLQVYFYDAGAAHSGNHWTLIVSENWLFGKSVLAEGFSTRATRLARNDFPATWLDNHTAEITFAAGRGDDSPQKAVLHL